MPSLSKSLALAAALTGLSALAAAPPDDDQIDRYKKYLKSSEASVRADAALGLGAVDSAAAVEILVGALKDRAEEVRDSAVQALSGMKSDEAIAAMVLALSSGSDPGVRAGIAVALGRSAKLESLDALVAVSNARTTEERRAAAEALGSFRLPDASEALARLARDTDTSVRISAVKSLGRSGVAAGAAPVVTAIADPVWQVRSAAFEAAGKIRDKSLIAPLIEQMEREEGRLLADARGALEKIVEMDFGPKASEWKAWWDRSGAAFEVPVTKKSFGAPVKASGTGNEKKYSGPGVHYYGIQTPSKHMIFLLDVSKSMAERTLLPGADESGNKPGSTPRTAADGSAVPTLSGKTGRAYTSPVKIEIAKEELVYTLAELDDSIWFDIVLFETKIERWKGELVQATSGNRDAAIAFVKKQKAREAVPVRRRTPGGGTRTVMTDDGRTNLWGAIEAAFGATPTQPDDKYYRSKLDTIFLLSDGLPTDGEITSTDEILERVRQVNGFRNIVIHTIQMGKITQSDFLKNLAEENRGTWVNLTP